MTEEQGSTKPILVSSQSERELAQAEASREVQYAVRQLAINVLRIVRGAGKPHELMNNMGDYAQAAHEYFQAFGYWPTQELQSFLSVDDTHRFTGDEDDLEADHSLAIDRIIAGSLQVAASRLAGQRTHVAAGESELHKGIRELETAQKKSRARFLASRPKPAIRRVRPSKGKKAG